MARAGITHEQMNVYEIFVVKNLNGKDDV